jgi:hypothetical protein
MVQLQQVVRIFVGDLGSHGNVCRTRERSPSQLNDAVQDNIERLGGRMAAFFAEQKDPETDGYGRGSKFIPHFLGIDEKLDEFRSNELDVVRTVHDYIGGFKNMAKRSGIYSH